MEKLEPKNDVFYKNFPYMWHESKRFYTHNLVYKNLAYFVDKFKPIKGPSISMDDILNSLNLDDDGNIEIPNVLKGFMGKSKIEKLKS